MFDVTLSFDNGPEPDATPAVLDILAGEGIAASFFVLGRKLADPARRALAERAHAAGHWIGNHTYSHDVPLGRRNGAGEATAEIGGTEALVGDLAHPDKLFRPFGGGGALGPHLLSPEALEHLKRERYTCVLWNAVPRDWEDAAGWPERALALIRAQAWSLLVLHDLPNGAMAALPRFIAMARAAGVRFRQDFPPDCVPLRTGVEAVAMAPYVTGHTLQPPAGSGTPEPAAKGV